MSESFEKLQSRIVSDAKLKAEEVIREAEEKARRIVEEARAQAQKEAAGILSKARFDAEALKRSIISSKVRTNQLRRLEERNRIIQEVLHSVENELSAIPQTEGFRDAVKKMVDEAVEAVGTAQPIVRVGFREASKKELDSFSNLLPKGAKLVVEDKAIDELGGVIVTDPQGKLSYNNSFKARMDRLDTQLLSLISSTVFA